jgi:hypothetical protein
MPQTVLIVLGDMENTPVHLGMRAPYVQKKSIIRKRYTKFKLNLEPKIIKYCTLKKRHEITCIAS